MSSHISAPVRHRFAACVAILGVALVPVSYSRAAAATPQTPGGPTVTVNEPVAVTVTGPVEVQGTVEVLNDALKIPYHDFVSANLSINPPQFLNFSPIPAGKRLIVQTISVSVKIPPGQRAQVTISGRLANTSSDLGFFLHSLPVQSQGTFGPSEVFMGMHSVQLIMDAKRYTGLQIEVSRSGGGLASYFAAVSGYLEDVAAVSP